MTRRKNWLELWREWTFPITEAPESFLTVAALSTIASVVKRKVRFPRSYLGSYDIYPFLYTIFVGPPGSRKTTAVNFSRRVLQRFKDVNIAAEGVSASQFVKYLADTGDGSTTIISGEFGIFVEVSKEEMFDLLTKLFDAEDQHHYSTRKHGDEIIDEPCVNLLAATTPEWVGTLPRYIIGGGFASRVLFIFEQHPREREIYYDHIDQSLVESHFRELTKDLGQISQLKGSFKLDNPKTKEFVREWYRDNIDTAIDPALEGYLSRKHIHLHKLAMLLSIAESNDLVLTRTHFTDALRLLNSIEKKMGRALSNVGRNPFSADLDGVREFIHSRHGPVEKKDLIARFYRDLSTEQLDGVLDALIVLDEIRLVKRKPPTYEST